MRSVENGKINMNTKRLLTLGLMPVMIAALALGQSDRARQGRRDRVLDRGPVRSYEGLTRVINDCENRTDQFIGKLRRSLNDDRSFGERREQVMRSARELENAMDRTGNAWNRDRNIERTRLEIRRALNAGRDINALMRARRLDDETEREWGVVRAELNALARAADVPEMRW